MDGTRIGIGAESVHASVGHAPNASGSPCCSEISRLAGGVQWILYSASSPQELKFPGATAGRWTRALAIGCYLLESSAIQQCLQARIMYTSHWVITLYQARSDTNTNTGRKRKVEEAIREAMSQLHTKEVIYGAVADAWWQARIWLWENAVDAVWHQ